MLAEKPGYDDHHPSESAAAAALGPAQATDSSLVKIFSSAAHDGTGRSVYLGSVGDYHAVFLPEAEPEVLELRSVYDDFLATLGKHTRRQMRQLRRKIERFEFSYHYGPVAMDNLVDRVALGRRSGPEPFRAYQVRNYERFASAQDHNYGALLYSAASARAGRELISYSSGVISDGAAMLRYQMNHSAYGAYSLSLTLRAMLLESLIDRGLDELIISGGVSGVLQHWCKKRAGGEIILVRHDRYSRLAASVIARIRPHSPWSSAVRLLPR